MSPERALRQVLLVGADGQRAIEAATASVSGEGLAREVATSYAVRAGFADVTASDALAPGPEVEGAVVLCEPSCRAVLDGARCAMRAVNAALAIPR